MRAGNAGNGAQHNLGVAGFYWSSTIYSTSSAYIAEFHDQNSIAPQRDNLRYYGFQARCVANDTDYIYSLRYNPNSTGVANLPPNQATRSNSTSYTFTISPQEPTRSEYYFTGYAISPDGNVAYNPGDTVSVTSETPTYTLYAKWTPQTTFNLAYSNAGKTPVNIGGTNYYKMQDMTGPICNQTLEGQQITLVDIRDNKLYTAFKAKDNKCWMNQNLDLDLSTSTTLTNVNTDLNSVNSWTPERNMIDTGNLSSTTWQDDSNHPYSYNPGEVYWYNSGSSSNDIQYTSLSACATGGRTEAECKHYHAGNQYNFTAAVASNDISATTSHEDMPNSICPRGWRLPRGPYYDADYVLYPEFTELLNAYNVVEKNIGGPDAYLPNGFNIMRASPLYFTRAGYITGGSQVTPGLYGSYWTASSYTSTYSGNSAYHLFFLHDDILLQQTHPRSFGVSVRCVTDTSSHTYSIDFTPNIPDVANLPAPQVIRSTNTSHSFTVPSTAPTGYGHTFNGYATSADGPVVHQPGATITLTKNSPSLTLYAKWTENLGFNNSGITTMQAMTSTICSAASRGTTGLLKDTRDNKVYSIFKGNDDRCWMTQNLDLDLSTSTTLTNQNTDLNNPVTSWSPERSTIATGNLSSSTWSDDVNNPYSYDPGDIYVYTSGSSSTDTQYNSLSACIAASHTVVECKHYHVGNHYNFSAAVASNDTSVYSNPEEVAPNSVCPKGWKLPQGPTTFAADYSDLNDLLLAHNIISRNGSGGSDYLANGFINIRQSPIFLNRAGLVSSGSYTSPSYGGSYWTSSVSSTNAAYFSVFNPNYINTEYRDFRTSGLPVRCYAR